MKKTDKKLIEEFIRVDHAGERGAIKIYEGQLLALNTVVKNDKLKNYIFEFNDSTNIRDLLNHGFNRDEIINSAKEELSWETLLKDI